MKKTNQLVVMLSIVMIGFLSSCKQDCEKCPKVFTPPEGTYCYEYVGRPPTTLKYKKIVKMLRQYDKTRKRILKRGLGFEDTRVNFYTFQELKDYFAYIEKLSIEKEIPITGVSFISAAYPKNYKPDTIQSNYQTLIYIPTTDIDGKNVAIDLVQSKKDSIVTFKEMLVKYGYNWRYNSKEDYESSLKYDSEEDKEEENKLIMKILEINADVDSGAGNKGLPQPPF
ncbi:hypothetical protein C7447_101709 [Tenacibaculum adriaticum]|uniref:Lipoprotein n=1 Tax=Tenacibaculum adriaticum TaxID=413713 RepID=A0A5S5E005_9FLAO|nr:hypothetical protein [Tenacibaculum adriaticum]TYQ00100.1 hypothetical protein C7447_101709 [Tenacibaculum adriaticum]